jgi:cytoplasmic tRNA 2-thiolation protein 2
VTTKAVKRMETYKSRASAAKAQKKLLLPISFGPSSTSLLAILDEHLQAQLDRMGRTTYTLLLVHVDLEVDGAQQTKISAQLEKFKDRFPNHTCLTADITQALSLDIDWKSLGLEDPANGAFPGSDKARLDSLFHLISSATSKVDISSTLLTRLLVDIAKKNDCESILFGDSTTRLAEKTLIETAKGRGFSLPWQVSDGLSPYGVNFLYPLRELLKKELLDFSSLISPPLTDLIMYQPPATEVSASAKSTTIDDLMAQYFETVEEKFPAIVANVVRTSSKLKTPVIAETSACCGLCGLPVAKGNDGIYGWGGDQSSNARPTEEENLDGAVLCYGCSRSIND